jgi:signal transduction histidine kinase
MSMRINFEMRAKLGYTLLALILAIGMAVSIRRLSSVADEQIGRLRAEEHEITLVERLRWNSELIVSNGRGYLLSGDPDLLTQARDAEVRFDANLHALRSTSLGPRGLALVAEAQQAAARFNQSQEGLLVARQRAEDSGLLIRRFETELLPLRRNLEQALARLVGHKEGALGNLYDEARRARSELELRMYGLLGLLLLAGLGVAWYFATLLGRAYRQERDALDAARTALAARDQIMGIVAHDLRNPLGAITMKASLMRMEAESEKVREQSESIERIGMRMEHLIKSMLDVSTIEAGKFSVAPAPCRVEGLLRETMEMFESLSASKQVRLEQNVDERALVVRADRERVLQVLSNILGNALNFTPPGGKVTLSVSRQDGDARFTILDSGPGIPAEHLPHVFDRFWKAEKRGKQGTGLGLFIAKGIIDAHGGRIWAESSLGQGASFVFTLPTVEGEESELADANALAHLVSPGPKPA